MGKTIAEYLDMIASCETMGELEKVEKIILKAPVSTSTYMLLMRSINESFKIIYANT